MFILEFEKSIQNPDKFNSELLANATIGGVYTSFISKGTNLQLVFTRPLAQAEVDLVTALVRDYVPVSIVDGLKSYIDNNVRPFIETLLLTLQAENIEMGITQANKTADVLGFFTTPRQLPGKPYKISLKDTLDTNTLTVTLDIFNEILANPQELDALAPFITVERISKWTGMIQAALNGKW